MDDIRPAQCDGDGKGTLVAKRPIDQIRDSAGSMTLSGAGAIKEMIVIGGVMHMVATDSIHEVKLADAIDPKRTNPTIPNTQRKILELGSDSPIVCRTLLTAKVLFEPKFLRDGIDLAQATSRTFFALKELAGMKSLLDELDADQAKAIPAGGLEVSRDRSVAIPQVGGVERRCKEFVQKADHSLQELFRIAEIFFGRVKKDWFEGLLAAAEKQQGQESDFVVFLHQVLPFLKFVRETRNAIEHPAEHKHVDVMDFHIDATPAILSPTVAILLPGSSVRTMPLLLFFGQTLNQLTDVFETMIAYLAELNIRTDGGFKHVLLDLPADRRRYPDLRYCFGVVINGQVAPIS